MNKDEINTAYIHSSTSIYIENDLRKITELNYLGAKNFVHCIGGQIDQTYSIHYSMFIPYHLAIDVNDLKNGGVSDVTFYCSGITADRDTPLDILEQDIERCMKAGYDYCIVDVFADLENPVRSLLYDEIYDGELCVLDFANILAKYQAVLCFDISEFAYLSFLPVSLKSRCIYLKG